MNYNPAKARPLHTKKALHVVLKSKKATGAYSLKNKEWKQKIWDLIAKHAKANQIKIYSYANSGDDLHILLKAKSRKAYNTFIRVISGLIVRLVTGAQKGKKLKGRFWDGRPFSRIVQFGNDFKKVQSYLLGRKLETIGWIRRIKYSKKLSPDWKAFWHRALEVHP